MRRHAFVLALIAIALSINASSVSRLHARTTRSMLPSASEAQHLLQTTTRHREWVNMGTDSSPVLAFVVYPERDDTAPVVLVSVKNEQASVHARAIADQLAAEGFIGVVPDDLTGVGPNQVKGHAESLPAANGTTVWLNLDLRETRADVVSDGPTDALVSLRATSADWPQLVEHLSRMTRIRPARIAGRTTSIDEHAIHRGHSMAPAVQNQTSGSTASRMIPGLADKPGNLPASNYTATATLARSRLKSEWVDIPVGNVKVRNWVVYPEGNGKAGVVVVMQHGVGLDDWMRSVADQLAADRFIAIAPDVWSGTGPNGGNRDSFQFDDEAMRAAHGLRPMKRSVATKPLVTGRSRCRAQTESPGASGSAPEEATAFVLPPKSRS